MNLPLTKTLRPAWVLAAIAVIVIAGFWLRRSNESAPRYVTASVTRGPIVRSVIATGTVNPVVTVQVGSYVSGPIQSIYADFNAPVRAGQLIAKIDPRPFEVKVEEAQATLDNAKAQLGKDLADMSYKKVTFERNQRLLAAGAVSRDVLDSADSAAQQAVAQVALDRANIEQQTASVKDAQIQLNYTNIVAPVDGTVVSRNVDVGQTVAASFQTPTLFLIAKDLTQMQVDTNVSESDIGNVQKGATSEFTVDAFPRRTFQGAVTQVRQAPITVQNVVTYDVVITVANPELLLKPGMTANVTIVTASRDNATRIPLQALRYSPKRADHSVQAAERGAGSPRQSRVWTLAGNQLAPVAVTTGLDDGDNVELLTGDLKPGDEVVVDEARSAAASVATAPPAFAAPHIH
ncbi:MAG: efflux RND transporter periplasmic adaptor subunit [Candidatus Binataceae bacterium]